MASRDLHSEIKVVRCFPSAQIATDGTTVGTVVDTAGFDSCEFTLASTVLTDGTFAPLVEHGDAANLSDAATVPAAQLIGTIAAASFVSTEDNVAKKIGYLGSKRYVRISVVSQGTAASGTATILAGLVADEVVTIAGHAFTAKASGATGDQFNIGASEAATAANLAAAIRASVTAGIAGVVTAAAADAIVTITAIATGAVGNAITLTKTGDHLAVSGTGTLAGGDDATGRIGGTAILGHPRFGPVA